MGKCFLIPDSPSPKAWYVPRLKTCLHRSSSHSTYDLFHKDGFLWLRNNAQGPETAVLSTCGSRPLLPVEGPFPWGHRWPTGNRDVRTTGGKSGKATLRTRRMNEFRSVVSTTRGTLLKGHSVRNGTEIHWPGEDELDGHEGPRDSSVARRSPRFRSIWPEQVTSPCSRTGFH